MKWLMNLMSQNHSILAHHVYIKPGGVPDKLCIFPADELTSLKQPLSRDRWLSGPTMTASVFQCTCTFSSVHTHSLILTQHTQAVTAYPRPSPSCTVSMYITLDHAFGQDQRSYVYLLGSDNLIPRPSLSLLIM